MILGLDASLTSTGYCVMEEDMENLLDIGKITPHPKKLTEEQRIFEIANTIDMLIKKYNIDKVAIESQYLHKSPKTAMQLSRLRGALGYVIIANNCSIENLPPSTVRKLIMSNGSAAKEEVADFIKDKYQNDDKVIDLGEFCDRNCKAKNSDIYDAIAIALALKHII